MNTHGTGDFQGSETITHGTIMRIISMIHLSNPVERTTPRMNTKLWIWGDNDVSMCYQVQAHTACCPASQ